MQNLIDTMLTKKEQKLIVRLFILLFLITVFTTLHIGWYIEYYKRQNENTYVEYYSMIFDDSTKESDMLTSLKKVTQSVYVYNDGTVVSYKSTIGSIKFPLGLKVKKLKEEEIQQLPYLAKKIDKAKILTVKDRDKLSSLKDRTLASRKVEKIIYYDANKKHIIYPIDSYAESKEKEEFIKLLS